MKSSRRGWVLALVINTLATIHITWLYLRIPAALNLVAYEQGTERMPFQGRLLMMFPLRWAHHSALINRVAGAVNRMPGWFPTPGTAGIHPETVLEALLDLASILLTGLFVRRIYKFASRTGLATPLIYPLTLLMVAFTYSLPVSHPVRFVYDLPAMALFAAGLYLIVFRVHPLCFGALFLVATMNRETALLLLPVYWITQAIPWRTTRPQRTQNPALRLLRIRQPPSRHFAWQHLGTPKTLSVIMPLGSLWLLWHIWISAHFAANPSAAGPRLLLNLGTLLCPIAWPQMFSAAAYLWPVPLLFRRMLPDATLRAWTFLPLLWLICMLPYGLMIETRIFGELIPYYAVTVALIAEESVLKSTSLQGAIGRSAKT